MSSASCYETMTKVKAFDLKSNKKKENRVVP